MSIVDQILQLEVTLEEVARQRAALAGQPADWADADEIYRAVEQELGELLAGLSPEDEQWLETERARGRHSSEAEE